MIALTYCIAAVFLHIISLLKLLLNILKNKSTLVWFAKMCMLMLPELLRFICGVILTFGTSVFMSSNYLPPLCNMMQNCCMKGWKPRGQNILITMLRGWFEVLLMKSCLWSASDKSTVSAVWSRYLWSIFPQHFIPKALCLNIHWQTAVLL